MAEETALVSSEGMALVENILSTGRDLTTKEVEFLSKAFVTCHTIGHWLLLALYEGKAHKAAGKDNFKDFAHERLGITLSDRSINNYLCRARVERNIEPKVQNLHFSKPQIGLDAALELNKLPPSEQAAAWKEVKALDGFGTHFAPQIARALRNIVTRRLNLTEKREESTRGHGRPEEDEEDKPAAPPFVPDLRAASAPVVVTPPAPVRPKPNMTPIVPPTYDRGPEFDDEPMQEPAPPAPVELPAPTAPAPEPMTAEDCIGTIALSFVITFDKIMRGGGSLEELHMDVIAFRKKYSV